VYGNVPRLFLEQRERLEPKLIELGDTWDDCLKVVYHATTLNVDNAPSGSGKSEWGKEIIVWGETDAGYLGTQTVVDLLAKKDNLTLVISGGVYGKKNFTNEVGSLELYARLYSELVMKQGYTSAIFARTIIESMSQHTGHQRIILGPLLSSLAPEKIWVVIPINHITRFVMTVGLSMHENGSQPNIIPWPYGSWTDTHTHKAPIDNPDRKFKLQELFALPPTPSPYHEGIFYCGEIDKIIQYANPSEHQCLTFRQAREWLGI